MEGEGQAVPGGPGVGLEHVRAGGESVLEGAHGVLRAVEREAPVGDPARPGAGQEP